MMFLVKGAEPAMVDMMVIRRCSFLENGPGFRLCRVPKRVNPQSGSQAAAARPTGYAASCATCPLMWMLGWRMENNWLMKAMITEKVKPMTLTRIVDDGTDGSSLLLTTARTSA